MYQLVGNKLDQSLVRGGRKKKSKLKRVTFVKKIWRGFSALVKQVSNFSGANYFVLRS